MGLPAMSGQHDVVLLPLLTPRHSGVVVGLATVPQQQLPSQMPLQAYANYAMGPPQIGSQSWASHCFIFLYVCSCVCFLLSGVMLDAVFTYGDSTIATLWSLPMLGICGTWQWSLAHTTYAQSGCSLHCLNRGSLLLINLLSPAIPTIWMGIQVWGLGRESLNPSTYSSWWGGILFSRFGSIQWKGQLWIWWALNLEILVWWLGIRLMSLLAPGL